MPVLRGRVVTLRAETIADVRAIEPAYATCRDVAVNSRQGPRLDHVSRKTELPKIVEHRCGFAIVANDDGRFCGKLSVFDIDLHHRSVRSSRCTCADRAVRDRDSALAGSSWPRLRRG